MDQGLHTMGVAACLRDIAKLEFEAARLIHAIPYSIGNIDCLKPWALEGDSRLWGMTKPRSETFSTASLWFLRSLPALLCYGLASRLTP